jgi:SARP family transcriptional regulator, regulator of embCAB operon
MTWPGTDVATVPDQQIISEVKWMALRFHVLGPLEVLRDDRRCTPTAPKQRALLALLLLHANELLTTSRIVDELWGSCPPKSAVAALQMYVSGLRRVLAPRGHAAAADPRRHPVLQTEPSGYLMSVAPYELDVAEYRSLAAAGRRRLTEGRCRDAGDLFRQALALWRGPALADLAQTPELDHYAVRLEEERLALLQERIGIDLCLGRGLEVIGELAELCSLHPLKESFHQQLMLALRLSGRQADALGVYVRAREILIDEIGIEPGPALRVTQQALLDNVDPPNCTHDCRAKVQPVTWWSTAGLAGRSAAL